MVIAAGILIGVLLDAYVRGIRRLLPIGRGFALAFTCVAFTTLVAGAFAWGGYQLAVQADELIRTVTGVLDDWRSELDLLGIGGESAGEEGEEADAAEEADPGADEATESGSESVARFLLPDPENLIERVNSIFRSGDRPTRLGHGAHRRPRKPRITTTMTTAPTNQTILFISIFQSLFKGSPRPPPDPSVG